MKHSAHIPNQDVRMAVHGDDFVCLSDDDGLKHIDSLLKSKYTACVQLELIKLDNTWILNLTWDTHHSTPMNHDSIRTPKQ